MSDIAEYLNHEGERQSLDYKETFNWIEATNGKKSMIVKHILGMANAGGGAIVFGVRDSDHKPVGISEEAYLSFDQTKINDFVENYTDPKHTVNVRRNELDGKYIAVIEVPRFDSSPIICKKSSKHVEEGEIYVRTEKANTITIDSSKRMKELVTHAINQRQETQIQQNFAEKIEEIKNIAEENLSHLRSHEDLYDRYLHDKESVRRLEDEFSRNPEYYSSLELNEALRDFFGLFEEIENHLEEVKKYERNHEKHMSETIELTYAKEKLEKLISRSEKIMTILSDKQQLE